MSFESIRSGLDDVSNTLKVWLLAVLCFIPLCLTFVSLAGFYFRRKNCQITNFDLNEFRCEEILTNSLFFLIVFFMALFFWFVSNFLGLAKQTKFSFVNALFSNVTIFSILAFSVVLFVAHEWTMRGWLSNASTSWGASNPEPGTYFEAGNQPAYEVWWLHSAFLVCFLGAPALAIFRLLVTIYMSLSHSKYKEKP